MADSPTIESLKAELDALRQEWQSNQANEVRGSKRTRSRLRKLSKWRKQLETQFGAADREAAKSLVTTWKTWIAVLGVLGLGALAGAGVLVHHLNEMVESTQKSFDAKVDAAQKAANDSLISAQAELNSKVSEALKKADVTIAELVDEKGLEKRGFDASKASWEQQFQRTFDDAIFTHLTGLASTVKQTIQQQLEGRSDTRYRIKDPRRLSEMSYALDAVLEQYGEPLRAGNLPPNRRKAILYTVDGIADRARGVDELGRRWFELAIRTDPDMPEPYILLGRLATEGQRFHFGKFTNEDARIATLDYYRKATTIPEADKNEEARSIQCEVATYENKFRRAIELATTEIDFQEKTRGPENVDPRMYFRKGWAYWQWTSTLTEPEAIPMRLKAAWEMRRAFQHDPGYISALNNYIWFMTHDLHDKLIDPRKFVGKITVTEMDTELRLHTDPASNRRTVSSDDIAQLVWSTEFMRKIPYVQQYPRMLDTVAEAEAVLARLECEVKNAENDAQRAVETASVFDYEDATDLKTARDRVFKWLSKSSASTHPVAVR